MKQYLVKPGSTIDLTEWDPNDTSAFPGGKREAKEELLKLNKELESQQELLYAEHKHRVLVVLQAMDTGGKDGVIRSVFEGVNPQGVRVASYKVPSALELDHDYLWRIHQQVPGKGELVVFNRSHYEDVLIVRVHQLVPERVWRYRYAQIKAFERMLAEEGTTILKFYLHIDTDEQKKRLLERIEDPTKHWKFNPGDLEEHKLWPEYMRAYEDILFKTSTRRAPWYIVPANHNWYRNWVVASVIVQALRKLKMQYPESVENIEEYKTVLV
jgi:PPK2 family polyphosphate:nucleotide phosphotransferase